MQNNYHIYKGDIFFFIDSPLTSPHAYIYIMDGALVVEKGYIRETGLYKDLKSKYTDVPETDYSGQLIMPGFIDAHIHYAQTEMIGMYGKQLLDWLNNYTFPTESGFDSREHAERIADIFIHELFRNGTTTCVAYPTVHTTSVNALFKAASEHNMRIITGKVLMNQNAPEILTDSIGEGEKESRKLIEKWHGRGRNLYAITPRFAITCSTEQLRMAANLHANYPDTYIQTHLSENLNEIESTLSIHKGHKDYLEIYEKTGLITDRTLLGHCIHLSNSELSRIAKQGAIITHCPTSNMFLGSGFFDMRRANEAGVKTVMGTDVGGGTSFSMLKTMGESYKVMQIQGYPMSSLETFYKSTLGTARALKLEDKIGSFSEGSEADFIVVDCGVTPTQALRRDYLQNTGRWTIENRLFGLQTTGDDRNITATYLMGKQVF